MCYTISMNNKEYLDQISSNNRQVKQNSGFLGFNISPRLAKIVIGAFIAAILIIIIGSIVGLSGNSSSEKDYLGRIYLRTNNLMDAIATYNKSVKSSELRSMGTSLNAVLAETSYSVSSILDSEYDVSPSKAVSDRITEEEEADKTALNDSLEDARISGRLDRVFAHNFTYAISMLSNLEADAIKKAKKDSTATTLSSSKANLDQLYTQFDEFASR